MLFQGMRFLIYVWMLRNWSALSWLRLALVLYGSDTDEDAMIPKVWCT